MIVKTKICTKCGKELNIDMFQPHESCKDGLNSRCRPCINESARAYKLKNKEKFAEMRKKEREENPERLIAYRAKYAKENVEKLKAMRPINAILYKKQKSEYAKRSRKENPKIFKERWERYYSEHTDKVKEHQRRYSAEHKEKIKERVKKYRQDNPDARVETCRKYYKNNKIEINNYGKNYRKNNKEKCNVMYQRYRTKKRKLPHTLTLKQWVTIKNTFNNCCAYCGKELPLAQEHFLALSKGGEYTSNNIIPSCKSCNSSKNNKDFFTWYPKFRHYSKKREIIILRYLNYKDGIQQLTFAI